MKASIWSRRVTSIPMSENNYQKGGRLGALHGSIVEKNLAKRLNGKVIGGLGDKADVQEVNGRGHSVKSHRRSKDSRIETKSYSTCYQKYPEIVPYHDARENCDLEGERESAISIAKLLNSDRDRLKELFYQIFTGDDSNMELLTVYHPTSKDSTNNLMGSYRSYEVSTLIEHLVTHLTWEAKAGNKHWSINARIPGFKPIAFTISLGSKKRRIVLFTLKNVQKQMQFYEQQGHVPCVAVY